MMKNGFYFIVIALLVAKLFKILIYANLDDLWFHNVDTGVKSQKKLISHIFSCIELKVSTVITLITKFHGNTI